MKNMQTYVALVQDEGMSLVQEPLAAATKIKKTRWWKNMTKSISLPFRREAINKSTLAGSGDDMAVKEKVVRKEAASTKDSSAVVTKNCGLRVQQLSVAPSRDETICLIQKDPSSVMEKTYTEGRWWNEVKNCMWQPFRSSEAGDGPAEQKPCTRAFPYRKLETEETVGPVGGRGSQAGVQDEPSRVSRSPTPKRERTGIRRCLPVPWRRRQGESYAKIAEWKSRPNKCPDHETALDDETRARLDDPVVRHLGPMPENCKDDYLSFRRDQLNTLRVGWDPNTSPFPEYEKYNLLFYHSGVTLSK